LKGKLRANGKARGLSAVTHLPSGIQLDQGENGYGLFSHYRVFTANRRYGGGAWDWPGEARLRQDGSVEVRWPEATNRPFALRAVYRWAAADTLDLETVVEPRQDLPGFESFLASYFANRFTNALMCVRAPDGKPSFRECVKTLGDWQMAPRDEAAVRWIDDGRWRIEPNPVNWTLQPRLAEPIGVRRDPASGLTAVLQAPRPDCFAVAMPHQAEGHYSVYLSLFGRDLKAGAPARARARLRILSVFQEDRVIESQQQIQPGL